MKFLRLAAAGGDSQHFRADGPPAADVMGCIADHDNLLTSQVFAEHAAAPVASNDGDLIPILVVIAESTGAELLPQPVSPQLDFRAEANVAGEQADERRLGQRFELLQEMPDSRQGAALTFFELFLEEKDVTVAKPAKILVRRRHTLRFEYFAHQPAICPSGKLESGHAIRDAELRGKRLRKRPHARSPCADERAVDVEKNQPDHFGRKATRLRRTWQIEAGAAQD